MKKRLLLLATTPFLNDGLTKIEFDVYEWYKNRIEFEFATPFETQNRFGEKLREEGIRIIELPDKRKVVSYERAVFQAVKKGRYDVVYIHGNSALMGMQAIPSKLAGAGSVVAHCHNTKSDYPVVHYILKPFFNLAVDRKIGCSSLASKWAFSGRNVYTVPNGVDVNRFQYNQTARARVRRELGITDNTLIGHIGRFSRQKNHERILSVFLEYRNIDPGAKLLLIGSGEMKEDTIRREKELGIQSDCIHIEETSVPQDYMSAMDVMIMPSLFEGLCLVALEAQSNGLPLVISDAFAPETMVTGNVKEVSLEAGNTDWAEAVLHSANEKERYQLSEEEKSQLSWKSMMEKIGEILLGGSE